MSWAKPVNRLVCPRSTVTIESPSPLRAARPVHDPARLSLGYTSHSFAMTRPTGGWHSDDKVRLHGTGEVEGLASASAVNVRRAASRT